MRSLAVLAAALSTFALGAPALAGGFVNYGDRDTFTDVITLILRQQPQDEPCRRNGDVAECSGEIGGEEPATVVVTASQDRFTVTLTPYRGLRSGTLVAKYAEIAIALQYGEHSSLIDRFPKPIDFAVYCSGAKGAVLPAHDECVVRSSRDGDQAEISVVYSIMEHAPELGSGGGLHFEWTKLR